MANNKQYLSKLYSVHKLQLDSSCSALCQLYLEQGKNQKETALALNQTLSKTKQQISRALFELRKLSNDPDYLRAKAIFDKAKV